MSEGGSAVRECPVYFIFNITYNIYNNVGITVRKPNTPPIVKLIKHTFFTDGFFVLIQNIDRAEKTPNKYQTNIIYIVNIISINRHERI